MSRVRVYGRIAVGHDHIDVEADYIDGPIPCIAARERFLEEVLMPLAVRLVEDASEGEAA